MNIRNVGSFCKNININKYIKLVIFEIIDNFGIIFLSRINKPASNFLLGLTDQLPTYQEDSSVPLFQGLNEENQGMLKSYADFLRMQQKSSGESISK